LFGATKPPPWDNTREDGTRLLGKLLDNSKGCYQ
jgi:hypothetical protein